MGKELAISQSELLDEVRQIDPRVFDLAAERVAGRKRAEYIEELEAQLAELSPGDEDDDD